MGKKYLETKQETLESAILGVWKEAAKQTEDKLDPVNQKAVKKKFTNRKDKDIDNDGDVDSSDKFLHKRRKAVSKAMTKEGLEDSPNPANSQHLCAKNVVHEQWGEGNPVHGMHDTPDANGNIAWYDVMFEHGIERGVSINELKVTVAEKHAHKVADKDKKMLKAKKDVEESYEIGTNEYRDHTLAVTPGQDDPEWVAARDFKVASMKEALAKVWGLDEKALDKKENMDDNDEDENMVKGNKTETGGKVAKVNLNPKIKDD